MDFDCLRGCVLIFLITAGQVGASISQMFKYQDLKPWQVPDCVFLAYSTGSIEKGPLAINIGQPGRCEVEIEVIGPSPIEFGSLIISEAASETSKWRSLSSFIGRPSRKALWTKCDDSKFVVRMERKLMLKEDSFKAIKEIHSLRSVRQARAAGFTVNISIARHITWKGIKVVNDIDYPGWLTDRQNAAVSAVVESYRRGVSPHISDSVKGKVEDIPKNPRIGSWSGLTDGMGFVLGKDQSKVVVDGKGWIGLEGVIFPPMVGIGAGYEEHEGSLGEYVPEIQMWVPMAVMARFPSVFARMNPCTGY
jgi:hypothetical protein